MRVVTAREMQELDRRAIHDFAIPGVVLMENAGLRVFEAINEYFECEAVGQFHFFIGKGNNGGDGFVVARHCALAGHSVRLWLLSDPEQLQGDALINYRIASAMSLPMHRLGSESSIRQCGETIAEGDIIVDAIFGTGLTSAPRKHYAAVIDCINRLPNPVVAVDIPSGLHPDTGIPFEPCIEADLTVTFGLPKIGQVLYPGALYCGELAVGDISFPRELTENAGRVSMLYDPEMLSVLIDRNPDTHKGDYGHLFVIAGSVGTTGAAALTAEAAVRAGTGLVSVGIPESLNDILEVKLTEAMTVPLAETSQRTLAASGVPRIRELLLGRMTALALGPGISTHPDTARAVKDILASIDLPLVLDADALTIIAGEKECLKSLRPCQAVLTPHPGEMARLLACSTRDVGADRLGAARRLASETNMIVVLKGARTIIASPDGFCRIIVAGNAGMATGGSGDVLTGVIGGLLAQGYSTLDAAMLGTFLHGYAADIAVETIGETSLKASDIIDAFPLVLGGSPDL